MKMGLLQDKRIEPMQSEMEITFLGGKKVEIYVHVSLAFPEKYGGAVARAAGQCAVKMAMFDPPEFVVETRVAC